MCGIIVINRGEKEISTPKQFEQHFGFKAPKEDYYNEIDVDCCLCQVDVYKALNDYNIPYKNDCGDVYVGDLKNVVGDND